jgi:aspartyl/asparaginyl beta-hydroxylase (cupin superfamily)
MELRILAYILHRLPYASLCLYTLAISTPIIDCAKIASRTTDASFGLSLINWMLNFVETMYPISSFFSL